MNVLRAVSEALVNHDGHRASRGVLYPAIHPIAASVGQIDPDHTNTCAGRPIQTEFIGKNRGSLDFERIRSGGYQETRWPEGGNAPWPSYWIKQTQKEHRKIFEEIAVLLRHLGAHKAFRTL